ncbi:hypothetical protein SAMN06264364_13617 [Quadrisphaera granulorum]|uniref:Uncharacterized protein n=1 Tax=Quadrisphaera granulorum TaxID=317664 RepID=A0A315ZPZ1_9ACTN|nr:hypothetical protein [Quadrisphaera granulorum]PWJ47586.1 hypothetical protein BXY45_13617 [Quadrisphaera granulorum]SZE98716.1 hypothetical protein SAMN06264364_13617 [Quadrisphaera granulorum]
MLVVAIVRLAARLIARWVTGRERPWPPELVDLERQASVAMAMCRCGHIWHRHERPHPSTRCSECRCSRFRPAERPGRYPVVGG